MENDSGGANGAGAVVPRISTGNLPGDAAVRTAEESFTSWLAQRETARQKLATTAAAAI